MALRSYYLQSAFRFYFCTVCALSHDAPVNVSSALDKIHKGDKIDLSIMVKTRKANCGNDGEGSAKKRRVLELPDKIPSSSSPERGPGDNADNIDSGSSPKQSSRNQTVPIVLPSPESQPDPQSQGIEEQETNSSLSVGHQIPETAENRDERRCARIMRALLKLDSAVTSAWYPSEGHSTNVLSRNRKDAHSACRDLTGLMEDEGMPVLKTFFELGGVLRSIAFIKRYNDDDSMATLGRLLYTCMCWDDFDERFRSDFDRILSETAKIIVEQGGLIDFFRFIDRYNEWLKEEIIDFDQKKHDRSACNQTVADPNARTSTERRRKDWEEQNQKLDSLTYVLALIDEVFENNSHVFEVISLNIVLSLFDSIATMLELTGKFINCNIKIDADCLDAAPLFNSIKTNVFSVIASCFGILYELIQCPSIDSDESFHKIHKGILKKSVGFLKGCESSADAMESGLCFLEEFVEKFQLKTSTERFQMFWHVDVLHFLIPCVRLNPDYVNDSNAERWDDVQEAAFDLIEWIFSKRLIPKSTLLEEFGMASTLAAVLESKHDSDKYKKRAKTLMKSLCE